ncbi:YpoC family protein [Neobacillus sp. CF12]|uniref:YpoC family protein n=1 Tax=Neobacillus sp. CF12 TaxID=3055864 RepID=UPI0025A30E0E|nr:hypothetical protein [Neobacillus sp. CF12]MDM5331259.1 hypothetical protein [Neobacillus sp. CF12]
MDNQLIIPFLEELQLEVTTKNSSDSITLLLTEWKTIKAELEILYRNRDKKNTLHVMNKGIGLFLLFLFWSNDSHVKVKELKPLDSLEIIPVNLDERLGFIINRPNLFHSYRQLSELMMEQEKLYAKKNIVKKRLSQKG